MPKFNCILNLPGFSIRKVSGYQPLLLEIEYHRVARCGHCQSKRVRKKAGFMRTVAHELIGERRSLLRFKAYKLYCHHCQRYSNQRFPGIKKWQRSTERVQRQAFHQHTQGISPKQLAWQFKVGKATIERWYQRHYALRQSTFKGAHCPRALGIDEHFFSRRQGYATTLCDLKRHKVFDIAQGRYAKDLEAYLKQLPGKERVQVVCMDLSASYRALVQQHFPNAKIVADRFHVVRLMQHQCMQVYRSIVDTKRWARGNLGFLRKRFDKLSDKQLQRKDRLFLRYPALIPNLDEPEPKSYTMMNSPICARFLSWKTLLNNIKPKF